MDVGVERTGSLEGCTSWIKEVVYSLAYFKHFRYLRDCLCFLCEDKEKRQIRDDNLILEVWLRWARQKLLSVEPARSADHEATLSEGRQSYIGGVAEWLKAPVLKTGDR